MDTEKVANRIASENVVAYAMQVMDDLSRATALLKYEWITATEMESICASCADTMRKNNISKVKATYVLGAFKRALGWDKLPPGWTKESVKKYWDSLEGDHVHKVTDCIKRMKKHFGEDGAGGFCASIRDMIEGTTMWRGEE